MTLREYLDDRSKRARIAVTGSAVICSAAAISVYMFLLPVHGTTIERTAARLGLYCVVFVCVMTVIAAGDRLMRRTACPKCGESLGRLAEAHLSASLGGKMRFRNRRQLEKLKGCPSCGLNLDEEITHHDSV